MTAAVAVAREIAKLERRIEQLDRRVNNVMREARVTEVDHDKALVKVEAHELKTAWSPWMDRAGTGRAWAPPAAGERGIFFSPSGEPGQGVFLRGGFSDAFKAPSSDKDAEVFKIGEITITHHKDHATIQYGDNVFVEVKSDLVRGRFGSGAQPARFVATDKMAKIRKGPAWCFVMEEPPGVYVSHMPVVLEDPEPDK